MNTLRVYDIGRDIPDYKEQFDDLKDYRRDVVKMREEIVNLILCRESKRRQERLPRRPRKNDSANHISNKTISYVIVTFINKFVRIFHHVNFC